MYPSTSSRAPRAPGPGERSRTGRPIPARTARPPVLWGRILVTAAAFIAVVVGAGVLLVRLTPEDRVGDCVVALDLTVGHDDQTIADSYVNWTEGVLQRCAADGAVNFAVFPITNSTDADAPLLTPVRKTFEVDSNENSGNRMNRVQRWVDDDAPGEIARLFAEGSSLEGGTDILSAPAVAADYLSDADEVDFRHLILVTDGIHIEGGLDTRRDPLGQSQRRVEIDELRAEGLIPNLADVEVEMCGIGGGDHSESVSERQQSDIEELYRDLFAASGADLDGYETVCPEPEED